MDGVRACQCVRWIWVQWVTTEEGKCWAGGSLVSLHWPAGFHLWGRAKPRDVQVDQHTHTVCNDCVSRNTDDSHTNWTYRWWRILEYMPVSIYPPSILYSSCQAFSCWSVCDKFSLQFKNQSADCQNCVFSAPFVGVKEFMSCWRRPVYCCLGKSASLKSGSNSLQIIINGTECPPSLMCTVLLCISCVRSSC